MRNKSAQRPTQFYKYEPPFPEILDPRQFGICSMLIIDPLHEVSNNVVCAANKCSDQPAHTRSLIAYASRLSILCVKLLSEHYLEFLNLKGGYTSSSESTHVNLQHCWKSHVKARMCSSSFNAVTIDTFHNISSCLVGFLFKGK